MGYVDTQLKAKSLLVMWTLS